VRRPRYFAFCSLLPATMTGALARPLASMAVDARPMRVGVDVLHASAGRERRPEGGKMLEKGGRDE